MFCAYGSILSITRSSCGTYYLFNICFFIMEWLIHCFNLHHINIFSAVYKQFVEYGKVPDSAVLTTVQLNNILIYCVYKIYSIFIISVAIVLKAWTNHRCLIILSLCNIFFYFMSREKNKLTLSQLQWLRKYVFLYDKVARS